MKSSIRSMSGSRTKVRSKPPSDMAAHTIRINAEKGDPICEAELARRKRNRVGMFEPEWERKQNGETT